jgi:hypothetical protein
VTGPGAAVLDYEKAVYGKFPYVLGLIALVTFVLLVRWLPVRVARLLRVEPSPLKDDVVLPAGFDPEFDVLNDLPRLRTTSCGPCRCADHEPRRLASTTQGVSASAGRSWR